MGSLRILPGRARRQSRRSPALHVAILAIVALVLAACSSGGASSSPTSVATTSAGASASSGSSLQNLVPADIKARGYITIVSDTSFGPPWDFNPTNNPSEFDGIDPDLARAFTGLLGLQIHWQISPFDGIVPALKAGRYDLAMNGMTDTTAREQQIDMIHYVDDSDTIVVAKGNPHNIAGLADLCGKPVAVATGTHEAMIVQDYQSKCATAMTISLFPTNGPTFLAVKSDRAVATINGYAATFYLQDNNVAGFSGLQGLPAVRLGANPQGIGVPKSESGLRDAIVAALNQMIADGSYKQILTKWGIAANALDKAVVNAQTH